MVSDRLRPAMDALAGDWRLSHSLPFPGLSSPGPELHIPQLYGTWQLKVPCYTIIASVRPQPLR